MEHDLSQLSILNWILKHSIKNEKGEALDFRDRLFLLDILTDWSKDIVIKKCSQVGGSVVFNLKALFALNAWGWNIIYTMPTDSDVEEFVKTKTNGIIKQNPVAFAGASQDTVYLKQLGDRYLYFKGTVSKTAAISTSADLLVHDEASRSDQSTLETYKSRLKASQFRGRWLFSNPTTEKDAVDEAWKRSDQKEWCVTCEGCKSEQLLQWPQSIDLERKCFRCQICGKELTNDERRMGRWQAQNPGSEISGYHISHLMAPWISAAEIIADSEGDQEYFFNFVLGEPYNPGDLRVSASTILDNWTPRDLKGEQWYLGVDVGNIKHFTLGSEKGVVQVGRFTKWQDLDDMMKAYKPVLVIDANPDNTMSKYYVETYRRAYMSFFQENKNNPRTIVWWGEGDRRGIVYSNRNRVLDQMIDHILNAKMLFGIETNAELKRYLRHWETLRRVKVVDTKGIESYEWTSTTGEDHYVFSTLYFYLAQLTQGTGEFFSDDRLARKKEFIDHNNVVGDISDMIAQANEWNQ